MGGAVVSSISQKVAYLSLNRIKVDSQVVQLMFPLYFVDTPFTYEDGKVCQLNWKLITSNSCCHFHDTRIVATEENRIYPQNAEDWFFEVFYRRLFDLQPSSRALFKGIGAHSKMLFSFFNFMFLRANEEKAFTSRVSELAKSHCRMGVKAFEYGMFGEVILWTLDYCLKDEFTDECREAWVRLLSAVLRVMVPIAIRHEAEMSPRNKDGSVDHRSSLKTRQQGPCPHAYSREEDKDWNESLAATPVATENVQIFPSATALKETEKTEKTKELLEIARSVDAELVDVGWNSSNKPGTVTDEETEEGSSRIVAQVRSSSFCSYDSPAPKNTIHDLILILSPQAHQRKSLNNATGGDDVPKTSLN